MRVLHRRANGVAGETMLTTYTLYLRDGREGPDAFEPFMAETAGAAITRGQVLLGDNPLFTAVDVYFGETLLFRVQRPA